MNSFIHTKPIRDWAADYASETAPWDTGRVSCQLRDYIKSVSFPANTRALDLGCGSGTNASFLARNQFRVTGVDLTVEAMDLAKQRAAEAGVAVDWIQANALTLTLPDPFDFVFDRGCFHIFTPEQRLIYRRRILDLTHPGSQILMLCGNANEVRKDGPPVVTELEIRNIFSSPFFIDSITPFRLDTKSEGSGPLAYACRISRTDSCKQ